MKFDKSKVYTALNADELHVGDVIYAADDLMHLRELVENDRTSSLCKIIKIYDDSSLYRFCTDKKVCNASFDTEFGLAYLVKRR